MTVRSTKFAVVGAGPIGSAAARHLAVAGHEVALIGPGDVGEPAELAEGPWAAWSDESRMLHEVDLPVLSAILGKRARSRFDALQEETGIVFATPHEAFTITDPGAKTILPEGVHEDTHFNIPQFMQNAMDVGVRVIPMDADEINAKYPEMVIPDGFAGLYQPDSMVLNPRRLVAAETAAAIAHGAIRVEDWVERIDEVDGGVILHLHGGDEWRAEYVVVAAGAYINFHRLLPEQLDLHLIGLTVALVEVDPSSPDFPTLMYAKDSGEHPFSGLIVAPLQYPDGKWYVKGVGGVALRPLVGKDDAEDWIRQGGDVSEAETFVAVLQDLIPDVKPLGFASRPCIVSMNDETLPYIGHSSERVVVATEGDHGVTIADEVGRLAAELVANGEWTDSIPAANFALRYVS